MTEAEMKRLDRIAGQQHGPRTRTQNLNRYLDNLEEFGAIGKPLASKTPLTDQAKTPMKFDLKQPCKTCPFRLSEPSSPKEQAMVWAGIFKVDHSMTCHDTIIRDADGNTIPHAKEQHCAGAMLVLEACGKRNNVMQMAVESGAYRPENLQQTTDLRAQPLPAKLDLAVAAEITRSPGRCLGCGHELGQPHAPGCALALLA